MLHSLIVYDLLYIADNYTMKWFSPQINLNNMHTSCIQIRKYRSYKTYNIFIDNTWHCIYNANK